jgi:hypothetical protein
MERWAGRFINKEDVWFAGGGLEYLRLIWAGKAAQDRRWRVMMVQNIGWRLRRSGRDLRNKKSSVGRDLVELV